MWHASLLRIGGGEDGRGELERWKKKLGMNEGIFVQAVCGESRTQFYGEFTSIRVVEELSLICVGFNLEIIIVITLLFIWLSLSYTRISLFVYLIKFDLVSYFVSSLVLVCKLLFYKYRVSGYCNV